MRTKVLLIHGFEGSSTGNWFPWLEKELIANGYDAINKTFPNPNHPKYEEVMNFLEQETLDFTENDIVIGHSLGAYFALKLAEEKKFKAVILVAPAIGELSYEKMQREWNNSDIDSLENIISLGFEKDKIQAKNKIAYFSSDDLDIPLGLKEKLDNTWVIRDLKDRDHINQETFPEVLTEIKNLR